MTQTEYEQWKATNVLPVEGNKYVKLLKLPKFDEEVKIRLVLEPQKRIEFLNKSKEIQKKMSKFLDLKNGGVSLDDMNTEDKEKAIDSGSEMTELKKEIAKTLLSDGPTAKGNVELGNPDLDWIEPTNFQLIMHYVENDIDPLGLKASVEQA